MTVPPGGPYGQNPYGQDPYWGGQPQGGQPQGGQPQGGSYGGQPQGGAYGGQPQGGAYDYPADPYAHTAAAPYPGAGYPPQQYPQPGWPGGPYPPGPPPGGPGGPGGPKNSKLPWLIVAGIAVVGVIGLVLLLIFGLSGSDKSSNAGGATSTSFSPQPSGKQTATDCTPNVSGGAPPTNTIYTAGKLSFPISAVPDWGQLSDTESPNLIDAVGAAQEVPGANQWAMQAEVAISNFVPNMDISTQASKLMKCLVGGPGYANAQPTLGPIKTSTTTVDGTKAARADADVTIGDTSKGVKGDSVVIIAVDTKPVTVFLATTPIGDTASADTISQVIASLKVAG